MAREEGAAARGVTGAVHRVGPADLHAVDRRVPLPALVDGEGEAGLSGLEDALRLPVLALERDADHALARLGVEPHLEVLVGPEHVGLPVGMAEERRVSGEAGRGGGGVGRRPAPDREPGHEAAVDPHVQVLRGAEAADVVGVGALQAQPDGVLAVHREAVAHRDAPARAEREVLAQPVVLVQQQRDAVGLDARHRRGEPHREPADLARRREVAFQEGRRDRQHRRHVVEAVLVGVVGRQEGRDVDLDLEQVAHRVAVLGPVQAVERLGAAHAGVEGGGSVEPRLEIRHQGLRVAAVGPGTARRRHRADPQLADDVLPDRRVAGDVGQVRRVEGESRRAQPLVVADDAVAVERGPMRRGVGRRLGARRRGGAEHRARGAQQAGESGRGGCLPGGKGGSHSLHPGGPAVRPRTRDVTLETGDRSPPSAATSVFLPDSPLRSPGGPGCPSRSPAWRRIDHAIGSCRERIAVPFQRIQVPPQGGSCPLNRFPGRLAVDVKPLERRAVRMEFFAVRLHDDGNPDPHPCPLPTTVRSSRRRLPPATTD